MVNLLRLSRLNPLRLAHTPSSNIQWSFVWLRVLPLTFLTFVALLPAYVYITEDKFDLLPILALILFLPRPILVLRTMVTAIGTVHDEMRANRWDVLILTGFPARKIVWRKWVAVVKQTAFDHFIFSLLHIGLSVAVSEFLNTWSYNYKGLIFAPYNYYADVFSRLNLYPSVTTFIIGIFVIGIFGLLECGLAASVGLTAAFATKRSLYAAYIMSSICFVGSILVILMIWFELQLGNRWINYSTIYCHPNSSTCDTSLVVSYYKVAHTLGLAFFVPIDQGTMLAANLMRPYDDRTLELPSGQPAQQTFLYKSPYDNRPFVLRNLLAALLGAGIYALLIRVFLRRATRFAIINHGASGYLEL